MFQQGTLYQTLFSELSVIAYFKLCKTLAIHKSLMEIGGFHFSWILKFQKVLQVFIEPFNFSFLSITGWGISLHFCDIEWFALEMNRDHSVIFEIASKYCISDSFVDYDGYSISSRGFLPTVVDIMVISVKFTHSSPFQLTDSQNVNVHSLLPSPV